MKPSLRLAVARSKIVDMVVSLASVRASKELKKSDGSKRQRLSGISKLDDANDAGGRFSGDCTLILTEGDSAKALAVSCHPFCMLSAPKPLSLSE